MSADPVIDVFIVDIEAARSALEAEESTTARLSAVEIARFDHKARALGEDEARDWRAAHIALRIILEREAGQALRGVAFDHDPGGRPRVPKLAGIESNPEFSLAHAGRVALIAISNGGAIGADIEVTRVVRMSDDRRQRIIGAAARLAPALPLPEGKEASLLQSWVRLEAVAKATGLGIGRILTAAGVSGRQNGRDDTGPSYDISVADLALGPECFAAIAAPWVLQNIAIQAFPANSPALAAFQISGLHGNRSENR